MRIIFVFLFFTAILNAQEKNTKHIIHLTNSKLDSVAIYLFEKYNFCFSEIDSIYHDSIERDTTIVKINDDSVKVTFHYFKMKDIVLCLNGIPADSLRFLDDIVIIGDEKLKLLGLSLNVNNDNFEISDSENSYFAGNPESGDYALCVQRLDIPAFKYRAEFEFYFSKSRLLQSVSIIYTNPSEWSDYKDYGDK